MSKYVCDEVICEKRKTNRTNLEEARLALGESVSSMNTPYSKKYDDYESNPVACYVCEGLEASTRNAVLKSIKNNLKSLHFNKSELSILIRVYMELLGNNMKKDLSIQQFKQFLTSTLGILEPFALDGISRAVRHNNSKSKTVTLDEFLRGLSILLRGDLNERIDFAFKVIDFDTDGYFRKNNEIASLLFGTFDPQIAALNPDMDPEEPERDTVNYLFQRFNNNGPVISLEDFRVRVLEEPLLLESLISFLPSQQKSTSFQTVLFSNTILTDQFLTKVVPTESKIVIYD